MWTVEETTVIRAPVERCFDLARSVEVHLAGNTHCGETAMATAGVTSGLVGLADRVTWRAKHFGVWHKLTSEIAAMDRPVYFQDVMIHPRNGSSPRALNGEMVMIVQHEQRRTGRSGSPGG